MRRQLGTGRVVAAIMLGAFVVGPNDGGQSGARAASRLPVIGAASSCPVALNPGSDALPHVMSTARRYLVTFSRENGHVHYIIDGVESLAGATWQFYALPGWRANAVRACGRATVNRSWIVFVRSPQLERCCSWWQARFYLARTVPGWKVWRVCNNSSC